MNGNKRKKEMKLAKLKRFSDDLRLFQNFPNDDLTFQCPICLTIIPVSGNQDRIDFAHIIPESAGGKMMTLACKKCDNNSGSQQDKWLGDLLNCERKGVLSVIGKRTTFQVNGESFNGKIVERDEAISAYIYTNLNPPNSNVRLREAMRRTPHKWTLTIPNPVDLNMSMAFVGLLTAAYLSWFDALGYSWVHQKHLGEVRRQIMNPKEQILPKGYVQLLKSPYPGMTIGAVSICGMVLPCFVYYEWLVMLPSFETPNPYSKLRPNLKGEAGTFHQFGIPVDERKVLALNKVGDDGKVHPLILPDKVRGKDSEPLHFLYLNDNPRPVPLRRITKEERSTLMAAHKDHILNFDIDLRSKELGL